MDTGTVAITEPRRIATFFVYLNTLPNGIGHTKCGTSFHSLPLYLRLCHPCPCRLSLAPSSLLPSPCPLPPCLPLAPRRLSFPKLRLSVQPRVGTAVLFPNVRLPPSPPSLPSSRRTALPPALARPHCAAALRLLRQIRECGEAEPKTIHQAAPPSRCSPNLPPRLPPLLACPRFSPPLLASARLLLLALRCPLGCRGWPSMRADEALGCQASLRKTRVGGRGRGVDAESAGVRGRRARCRGASPSGG